jgi:hypothetical protein
MEPESYRNSGIFVDFELCNNAVLTVKGFGVSWDNYYSLQGQLERMRKEEVMV